MRIGMQIRRCLAARAHAHQPRLRCVRPDIRPEVPKDQFYGMSIVTDGQDVAPCGQAKFGTRNHVAKSRRPRHAQVVCEHAAVKSQLTAQDAGNPALRQTGRQRIHRREHHMSRHDSGKIVLDERPIGPNIRLQIGEFAPIHRQGDV